MKRFAALACLTMVAVLGSLAAFGRAAAEDPAPATQPAALDGATGIVCGIVMKDGKPAEGIEVRLLTTARAGATKADANAPGDNAKGDTAAGGGQKGKHRPVISQGTTDANGKFTLSDVPAGTYRVVAGTRKAGVMGAARISVTAGQTAQVNLSIQPVSADRPAHRHRKSGK